MTDYNSDARYQTIRDRQNENRHRECIGSYKPQKRLNILTIILCTFIAAGAAWGMTTAAIFKSCAPVPHPSIAITSVDCGGCHNKKSQFSSYFKKAGSPCPDAMAEAVLKTRSPRVLSAIAKVESGGTPTAKHPVSQAKGAFQVKEKYWGKVSADPVKQALQAEAILEELTDKLPIKKALSVYGGDSSSRYQRKVLAELAVVP